MLSSKEKLRKISDAAYQDAQQKCDAILAQTKAQIKQETDRFEMACLEDAYKIIKKQTAQIVKEANETVSKAEMETRRAVLSRREEMVNTIFEKVAAALLDYQKTEEYQASLLAAAKEALSYSEGEGVTVVLAKRDAALASQLAELEGITVLVSDTDTQIGGIKICVNNTNKCIDQSYARRLQDAKERFLKSGKLTSDTGA